MPKQAKQKKPQASPAKKPKTKSTGPLSALVDKMTKAVAAKVAGPKPTVKAGKADKSEKVDKKTLEAKPKPTAKPLSGKARAKAVAEAKMELAGLSGGSFNAQG